MFNLDVLTIQTLESSSNPFVGLIRKIPPDVPVYRLIQFLETLDRYDVIDDTIALMGMDKRLFITRKSDFHVCFCSCGLENDLHLASSQAASEAIKTDIPQLATIGEDSLSA